MDPVDLKTRQRIKNIGSSVTFEALINNSTLSELDKNIVYMHYVQEKSFGYIGDVLGYSESGIKKRHKKILNKLSQIL